MITGKPAGNVVPTCDCARTGIAEKINNSPTAAVAVRFIEIPPSNWLRAGSSRSSGDRAGQQISIDASGQRAGHRKRLVAARLDSPRVAERKACRAFRRWKRAEVIVGVGANLNVYKNGSPPCQP